MNPVIGNKALEEAFGTDWQSTAGAYLSEQEKIRCHLMFACRALQSETQSYHPVERTKLLCHLDQYISNGQFPRNEQVRGDHQRAPCFVDSIGTPCAVAYLLLSSSRDTKRSTIKSLVTKIADGPLQYATVAEIVADTHVGPRLVQWAGTCGFSTHDLALIQPTYDFVVPRTVNKRTNAFLWCLLRLHDATKDGKSIDLDHVQTLAHDICAFGDQIQNKVPGRLHVDRVILKDTSSVIQGGFGWSKLNASQIRRDGVKTVVDAILKRLDDEKGNVTVQRLTMALRAEVDSFEGLSSVPPKEFYDGLLSPKDMAFWVARETVLPIALRGRREIDLLLEEMRRLAYQYIDDPTNIKRLERDVIVLGDDLRDDFLAAIRNEGDPTLIKQAIAFCLCKVEIEKSIESFLYLLTRSDRCGWPYRSGWPCEPSQSLLVALCQSLKRAIATWEALLVKDLSAANDASPSDVELGDA